MATYINGQPTATNDAVTTDGTTTTGSGTLVSPIAVKNGGVGTTQLSSGAVTGANLASGAVANANLASGAVATDGSTVQGDGTAGSAVGVKSGGIGATQLASGAVTNAKLASGAVATSGVNVTGDGTSGSKVAGMGEADWIRYVDLVNGSDSNAGTAAGAGNAWQTLTHAYSMVPVPNNGKCRIFLSGAGPYPEPQYVTGAFPEGPNAEPLIIIGDAETQQTTGTCTSVSGAVAATGLSTTADQYRGMVLHVLTGTGAGNYGYIATNDASGNLTALNNDAFGMAANSTFEILTPTTVINCVTNSRVSLGKIAYHKIKLSGAGTRFAANYAEVVYDRCELALVSSLFSRDQAMTWLFGLNVAGQWFRKVTDVGTQSGVVGCYLSGTSSVQALNGGVIQGYAVSKMTLSPSSDGEIVLTGFDYSGSSAAPVVVNTRARLFLSAYNRINTTGASSTGVSVTKGGYVSLTSTVINGCTVAAVDVESEALAVMQSVTGTGSGGSALGLKVGTGGRAVNVSGNAVTGSGGDVGIDGKAGVAWATQGSTIKSADGSSGSRLFWAGGFLGATSGAQTFYFPMGGLPGSVASTNNSATQLKYPLLPGGVGKRLAINVLANALTVTTTFTVMKNTSTTTLTVAFTTTTTGVITDTTHSATWNDSDTVDLQATATGGGASNALTFTGSMQVQ